MHPALQVLTLCFTLIATVGGLGFFFLRVSERLDRTIERLDKNYNGIQEELKKMHGKVCVIEEQKK